MTFSPHIGAYRTNPRPQPSLPRKTSWWRRALWWARGGPRRMEAARRRRDPWREMRHDAERMASRLDELNGKVVRLHDEFARRSIEVPVADVRLEGSLMRVYDHDGESVLLDWEAPTATVGSAECPVCLAVPGEPCHH